MAVIRAPHPLAAGDLGVPLHAVTFVVVDLETTGGSPAEDSITEIGAVKVRGGEVLAELQTLVDPGRSIPLSVQRLTGITETMTSTHLPLEAVLPTFLEFARGACVVAHNARFDLGFLRAASSRLDYPAPPWPVVCTALLARRLVRDEVANLRLATLAQHFRCRTRPTHRALADARATVEVLHALLERAGTFGVVTLDDLVGFTKVRDAPLYKARRGLADALPHAPGVYAFLSASGEVLYVGKATDLRARVRSYFGGDERRRVTQMLREATAVEHAVCDSLLEAEVREVRLIAAHQPRYNRRSRHLRPAVHLKLTRERFPRLSIVAEPRDDGAAYLGPLSTRRAAEALADALYEVAPLRRCSARITRSGDGSRCVLAEIGRCPSPCDGSASEAMYAPVATAIARAMAGDPSSALSRLGLRMDAFALAARFERAAGARDQLSALVTARTRAERLAVLARVPVIVASRREGAAVTLARIQYGRLVSTARLGCGDEPAAHVWRPLASAPDEDGLLLAALGPAGPPAPPVGGVLDARAAEEVELVAGWLGAAGVRLEHVEGVLASPVAGGALLAGIGARIRAAHRRTGRPASEVAAKRIRRG